MKISEYIEKFEAIRQAHGDLKVETYMKISEYIEKFEAIRQAHGDLEVQTYSYGAGRVTAPSPEVAFCKVLRPRERRPEFYNQYYKAELGRGEKVVRI